MLLLAKLMQFLCLSNSSAISRKGLDLDDDFMNGLFSYDFLHIFLLKIQNRVSYKKIMGPMAQKNKIE